MLSDRLFLLDVQMFRKHSGCLSSIPNILHLGTTILESCGHDRRIDYLDNPFLSYFVLFFTAWVRMVGENGRNLATPLTLSAN